METSMRQEMEDHLEHRIHDLIVAGLSPDEAKRRARLEFGSVDAAKDACRESVGLRWPLELARDLRYAARVLRKSPGFSITVVLTLALCVGVNTSIFSLVDWLVLRPLPYPHPDRLAAVISTFRSKGSVDQDFAVSGRALEMFREAPALETGAYAMRTGANLLCGQHPEYVQAQRVTAGYFHVLGASPAMGREFTSEEDRPGGPTAAILSYGLWNRLFHADTHAIGRMIQVRGEASTVVGIMPASFRPLETAELWIPLRPSRTGEGSDPNYRVVMRLRDNTSWPEADAQVQRIGERVSSVSGLQPGESLQMRLLPIRRELMEDVRSPLLVLWASVLAVLVVGCTNIGGLLLVRAVRRGREIGTRMALGSGRGAIIRQLLSETLLLAVVGGAAGILLGYWGLEALKLLAGAHLDLENVSLDGRILLITAAASVITGLIFGLVPAWEATRLDIRNALAESGGRTVAGGPQSWARRGLVITQVALSVVLLVVAGLLVKTFLHLSHLEPGFDPQNLLTASVSLEDARYRTAGSVNRMYRETLQRIKGLPGVESAAVALTLPYERALNMGFKYVDGSHVGGPSHMASLTYVTPGYTETLRIPLLRGRTLNDGDITSSRPVAVVNEAFVRGYLSGRDPLGSHIATGGAIREIVGIVGNVQLSESFGNFSAVSTRPAILVPAMQMNDRQLQLFHTWFTPSWIVRASKLDRTDGSVRRAIAAIDPGLPLASFRRMDDVISQSIADQRFQAILTASLAALALMLAALGIYGLIANLVAERTREFGIRLALGATAWQAMRSVALPGLRVSLLGVGVGCVLARASVPMLKHVLYGVPETDLATFIAASLVLLLAAVIASFIPALRVAGLNPADTLRAE